MSKNVEINIVNSSGGYEVLYPKTLSSLVEEIVSLSQGGTGGNYSSLEALRVAMGASKVSINQYIKYDYKGTGTNDMIINSSEIKAGSYLTLRISPDIGILSINSTSIIPTLGYVNGLITSYINLKDTSVIDSNYGFNYERELHFATSIVPSVSNGQIKLTNYGQKANIYNLSNTNYQIALITLSVS